jgi:peptidyl-tRNA hydrolase, PTH1 family
MKIIIGLGNPGKEYLHTRHNLGYLAIDRLASDLNIELKKNRMFSAETGMYPEGPVLLAKPLTFVNLSGLTARKLMEKHAVPLADLLVICDDFSLPLGKTRLRMKGSSGGHNGLQSVIEQLNTPEFPRLRLGMGPLPELCDPKEFVLGRFLKQEQEAVEKMIEEAASIARKFILTGNMT